MSLIHDSLRKLESNQSNDDRLDSNFEKFNSSNGLNAKKMWILIVALVGIVLIAYAYLMLSKYQNENELLLKDMKQLQDNNQNPLIAEQISEENNTVMESSLNEGAVVQLPIQVNKPIETPTYANVLVNNIEQEEKASFQNNQNLNADILLENGKTKINKQDKPKPVTVKTRTPVKKVDKKLSIKETRLLVNNLQIQIDSKNTQEVNNLLDKLSQSSGENSIVYLRMKAYWSSTLEDYTTAESMYKKILFQKPDDIQANTNLALLEARGDKVEQALNRLKALRIENPTDKTIANYLARIESMYVK